MRQLDSLWGMLLGQSVISPKNVQMARVWAAGEDVEVAELALIVAEIGRIHPGRKKRLPHIRTRHPALWARMVAAGVVDEWELGEPSENPREGEFPEREAEVVSSREECGPALFLHQEDPHEVLDDEEIPF